MAAAAIRRVGSAALVGAIGGLWLWAVTAAWPDTPDGLLHLQRTRALAEAWRQGVWYPRWFPDFAFGYGHPILHYYAPAAYGPPAAFHLAGLDVVAGTRLWLALAYGLSASLIMLAFPPSFHPAAALAAGILYLAYPYRLYDLFVRGALPEFAAFLWLPALLGGSLAVLARPAWSLAGAGLALAWAGLALTHNLTALMAALLTALLTVLAVPVAALARPAGPAYVRRFADAAARLGLPALVGTLLAAFYWLPALAEAGWVGIGAGGPAHGYANHFAEWDSLLHSGWRYVYPPADQASVPLPAYAALLALIGIALLILAQYRHSTAAATAAAVIGLAVAVTLMLDVSAPVWQATAPVLGKLQFPWRWQTMAAVPCAALAALGVQRLAALRPGWGWGVALATGVLVVVYAWPGGWASTTPDVSLRSLWAWDAEHGQVGATWTGEFLPVWVQAPRWEIGRGPDAPPSALPAGELTAQPAAAGYLRGVYTLAAAQAQTVMLDRFYFPAWRVTVDGAAVATRPQSDLGLLAFDLPAGRHTVVVDWAATRAVWLGRGLTSLGWLAVAWMLRARLRWLALWSAAGVIALVGITGLPVQTAVPQPVAADYGPVRLEAARVTSGQVDLFWTVNEALPELTVFVHVTGPDGAVAAQWDEPVGGPYRPPARLTPGLLLRQRVSVPLPPELPAGEYPVLVGVYAPGRADTPLIPAGRDAARVPAGVMSIRP